MTQYHRICAPLAMMMTMAALAWGQDPIVTPPVQSIPGGGTITININGPANSPFAFAAALSSCSTPTALGEFALPLNYVLFLDGINVGGPFTPGLTLGAGGTVSLSGFIPPTAAGTTIYGQSLVMSPSYVNGFKLSTNGAGGPLAVAHVFGATGSTTLAGLITYGDPGYVPGNGYPGGGSDQNSAVRFADVEAVNATSMAVLATGSTDAVGRYALNFPSTNDPVFIRAIAATDNNPKYHIRVRMQVNPSGSPAGTEPIWSRASGNFPGNANNSAADFNIPINPGTTTNNFNSAPFNVLDVMIRVADAVRPAVGTLPPVHVYSTPNFGEQGAFYGGKDGANIDYVFLSGGGMGTAESTDTDFYDDGVIGHETGHFVETLFNGSSPGGSHTFGQRTIPPLAWGEGYGTFVGGVSLGSPVYADGGGYGPASLVGFTLNLESEPSHGTVPHTGSGPHGIYDESVVFELLWDLHDGNGGLIADSDGDGISLSLATMFTTFSQFTVNDYVYIIDMLSRLDSANGGPLSTAELTTLMTVPEVTGITYPPVGTDVVPTPIAIGGSATGTTDATAAGTSGLYPGSGNVAAGAWTRTAEGNAFFEFVATSSSHTVTLTHTSPAGGFAPNDVDLIVTNVNSTFYDLWVEGGPGQNVHTVNATGLVVGQTYLIWARGWAGTPASDLFSSAPFTPSAATTFTITVN